SSRDLKSVLAGLVRVRRGANGHLLATLSRSSQVGQEARGVQPLDVDELLELLRTSVTEVLVRAPRIAVSTSDLAAAKGIHAPAERHGRARQPVQEALAAQVLELDSSPLVDNVPDPPNESRRRHSRHAHIVSIC